MTEIVKPRPRHLPQRAFGHRDGMTATASSCPSTSTCWTPATSGHPGRRRRAGCPPAAGGTRLRRILPGECRLWGSMWARSARRTGPRRTHCGSRQPRVLEAISAIARKRETSGTGDNVGPVRPLPRSLGDRHAVEIDSGKEVGCGYVGTGRGASGRLLPGAARRSFFEGSSSRTTTWRAAERPRGRSLAGNAAGRSGGA